MKKYNFSFTMMSPGNNANYTARVTYLGTTGERRIDVEFDEFSGEIQEDVIEKATKAVQNWINKHELQFYL